MTIVTKPLSEKKGEKPLVDDMKIDIVPKRASTSPGGSHTVPLVRTNDFRFVRERRVRSASTACLFLTALIVMSCGIVTGLYLYKQFVRVQMEKFHVRCSIPIALQRMGDDFMEGLQNELAEGAESVNKPEESFHEDFEITDNYEKITVPDFSGGRRSKFVHDFKVNKTGIIDISGHRCFVMPLNRSLVLLPGNLIDLVKKMLAGYYDVDTGYVRENMRVVMPAIEDRASLGVYIERECYGYPIYRLEKVTSGVYKRSAEPYMNFYEFSGKKTVLLSIINSKQLEDHEEQMPVAMA